MVRITRELLRKVSAEPCHWQALYAVVPASVPAYVVQRAEHHDGTLAELQELRLHQQNIEAIELIGQACRQLRILYLTNNLISSLRGLEHLKANRAFLSESLRLLTARMLDQLSSRAGCAGAHISKRRREQPDVHRSPARMRVFAKAGPVGQFCRCGRPFISHHLAAKH